MSPSTVLDDEDNIEHEYQPKERDNVVLKYTLMNVMSIYKNHLVLVFEIFLYSCRNK